MIKNQLKRLFLVLFCLGAFPLTLSAAFTDVSESYQYSTGINFLQERGIVSGHPDGSFKPFDPINRAEMAKILIESTGTVVQDVTDCFPDVRGNVWYAKYVCTAKNLGWVQGYPDGTYKPANNINRAESLKIIANAEAWSVPSNSTPSYSDVPLNEWFTGFTAYAWQSNFLPFQSSFSPASFINRGEFSEVYYRVLYSQENSLERFPSDIVDLQGDDLKPNKMQPVDSFANVSLSTEFPNVYFEDEIYVFSGNVSGNYSKIFVALFDVRTNATIKTFPVDVKAGGKFSIPVYFDSKGDFGLGIIPGEKGSTKIVNISVVGFGDGIGSNTDDSVPSTPRDVEIEYSRGETTFNVLGQADIAKVDFVQNSVSKTYFTRQLNSNVPVRYSDFAGFREAAVNVRAQLSNSNDDFTSFTEWSSIEDVSFRATTHHYSQITSEVADVDIPDYYQSGRTVSIEAQAQTILDNDLYVINPSGFVSKYEQGSANIGSGQYFEYSFVPSRNGTYIVEVNNTSGLAVINYPIYLSGHIPLMPDYFDLTDKKLDPGAVVIESQEVNRLLSYVNESRRQHGLASVTLDSSLSALARAHANDLIRNNIFSHLGSDGRDPNDRRLDFGIKTLVGENIAKVTSTKYGHEALMRSAVHRNNILDEDWTKVGLAIIKSSDGHLYIVQEFSFDEADLADVFDGIVADFNSNLVESAVLSSGAQEWTDLMVEEDFFNTEYGGDSLFGTLDTAGMSKAKSLILKVSDLSGASESLDKNTDLDNSEWDTYGFGVAVGDNGLIYITLVWGN